MKTYNLKITTAENVDWSVIERADIDSYVWGGKERAYKTYAQVTYAATGTDTEGLYIRLFCEEKSPVSKETAFDGEVCMDSCMEFFFTMRDADSKENGYLNIECNSLGTTHIGYGDSRYGRVFLPTFGVERFPAKVNFTNDGWEILEFVPIAALKKIFGITQVDETTVMAGNFYKCNENANAPFGSWSPVKAPKPDFHRPECFGRINIIK